MRDAVPARAAWLVHAHPGYSTYVDSLGEKYASINKLYRCWAATMLSVRELSETPQEVESLEIHVFARAAAGPGPLTAHPFHSETMHLDQVDPGRRAQIISQLRTYVVLCASITITASLVVLA